jgi:hypothetical protein
MAMRRVLKTRWLQWIILAGCLFLTTQCKADGICPWLNEATAAGMVNGPVVLEMNSTGDGGNACIFRSQTGSVVYSLEISVREMKDESKGISAYQSRCTSPVTSLRAIGNEAVLCSADAGSSHGEQIISRVRNNIFIVDISDSMAKNPSMTRDMHVEKIKVVAKQVAGNLF